MGSLLLLFLQLFPLPGAFSTEDVGQRIVRLMARVLVNEVVDAIEGNFAAPGARERRWIVDGELVENRVRAPPGEGFDHLQAFGRAPKSLERMKIRRLDDERIAFPPSDRIAHPGGEGWRGGVLPPP